MGVHIVRKIEDVKGPQDVFIPEYEPIVHVRIAACTHTGRKFSTVRMTCGGGTVKVCPACGEIVR